MVNDLGTDYVSQEVLWSIICGKSFNDPGPGDDDDPNCSGTVCKATKAYP